MEYFLHLEDDLYHAWQAELLIESFKKNQCEDKLLISFPSFNNISKINDYTKNLNFHKKVVVASFSEEKECKQLNKAYGMLLALEKSKIQQPFCCLELDSVLFKELTDTQPEDDTPEFIFSIDPKFTINEIEKNVGDFISWEKIDRDALQKVWIPLGESYIFQNFSIDFFRNVLAYAEKLAVFQLIGRGKVYEKTYELSLVLNLIFSNARIFAKYGIIEPISTGGDSNFISYKNGCPPDFHKSMFKFESAFNLSFGDPIEVLSRIKFSPNAKYISSIARRSIEKRK